MVSLMAAPDAGPPAGAARQVSSSPRSAMATAARVRSGVSNTTAAPEATPPVIAASEPHWPRSSCVSW